MIENNKIQWMREKIKILNQAAKAYYQENREIISNKEYDELYDELLRLEEESGTILSNSPSIHVGYELLTDLPKQAHKRPMLSLDKTKEVSDLRGWIGDKTGILSWKLDGLTIVMTYLDGKLEKAVTRGNGEVGEIITNNAKVFTNIPLNISHKGNLILRGEAVIRYSDFKKINNSIEDVSAKYKNPRNLCSGSVRQLNNKITAERNVHFFAFSIVQSEGADFDNSRINQLNWLKNQGFDVVEFKTVDVSNMEETVSWFEAHVIENDFPSDGLVLTYDDIAYGESLGSTSKFPRDSIAFKWRDEIKDTKLLKVEWSASRTGLINPIAVFEPVELEGTTVGRASVHNISIMEGLQLGIGDTIEVYKANMIIPQVSGNITKSDTINIPKTCPVCGGRTEIRQEKGVKTLYCLNDECIAKQIKSFTHFVGRNAMNIDGLSEATLEKFIAKGFIKELVDIFRIEKYEKEIIEMEGFGDKSYKNLIASINKSRKTSVVQFLYSLGIPNIGLSNAKSICKHFDFSWERIAGASYDEIIGINGIGEIMAEAYINFFKKNKNQITVQNILEEIEFEKIETSKVENTLKDMTFVVTGSLKQYANRNELKKIIEDRGGKVTDSVTSKTDYLINNDYQSNSSKNKKAKEQGIPIITEKQLDEWLKEGKPLKEKANNN